MSVLASGAVVRQVLLSAGVEESQIMAKLQPIATDMHALGNPWISYSVYLNNSFLPGLLQITVQQRQVQKPHRKKYDRLGNEFTCNSNNNRIVGSPQPFSRRGSFHLRSDTENRNQQNHQLQ